jgi:hypothetical protein
VGANRYAKLFFTYFGKEGSAALQKRPPKVSREAPHTASLPYGAAACQILQKFCKSAPEHAICPIKNVSKEISNKSQNNLTNKTFID